MKTWLFVLCIAVAFAATYSYGQAAEGAISGRIQGSNGQPLVGVRVTLLGIHYFYGKQYFYSAGFSDTNEIGEYQILRVPPGKYYVRIESSPENKPSGPSAYVSSTYYPGTNDMLHAKALVLEQGQKAAGIDFPAKPLSNGVILSGTVVNRQTGGDPLPDGRLRRYVGMYLIPIQDGPAEPVYLNPAQAASNEETSFPFEIVGVPPGTYDFYASFSDNTSFGELDPSGITIRFGNNIKTRHFQARKRIEVAQTNITGLNITIETGTEIHGRVSLHGEDKLQTSFRLMTSGPDEVRFLSMTRNQPLGDGSFPGKMEDDDRFIVTGLLPGSYQLSSISSINALELIDDAYLADLRQDGRSVFNDGIIKVGTSTVNVELVVNQNGGRIYGNVEVLHDELQAHHSVVLVPDAPRRGNRVLYKFKSSDERGNFNFDGVAPGGYKIFAFDGVQESEEENPELIRLYEQRGVTVTAKAGIKTKSKPVPIIRFAQ